MTNKELIAKLQELPEDWPVVFGSRKSIEDGIETFKVDSVSKGGNFIFLSD